MFLTIVSYVGIVAFGYLFGHHGGYAKGFKDARSIYSTIPTRRN